MLRAGDFALPGTVHARESPQNSTKKCFGSEADPPKVVGAHRRCADMCTCVHVHTTRRVVSRAAERSGECGSKKKSRTRAGCTHMHMHTLTHVRAGECTHAHTNVRCGECAHMHVHVLHEKHNRTLTPAHTCDRVKIVRAESAPRMRVYVYTCTLWVHVSAPKVRFTSRGAKRRVRHEKEKTNRAMRMCTLRVHILLNTCALRVHVTAPEGCGLTSRGAERSEADRALRKRKSNA